MIYAQDVSTHLLPPDIRLEAIFTTDYTSHLLSNKIAVEFLDHLGITPPPGQTCVGPVMFVLLSQRIVRLADDSHSLTASIRPCPPHARDEIDPNFRRYTSFDANFDLTTLARLLPLPQPWWDSFTVTDRSGFS